MTKKKKSMGVFYGSEEKNKNLKVLKFQWTRKRIREEEKKILDLFCIS